MPKVSEKSTSLIYWIRIELSRKKKIEKKEPYEYERILAFKETVQILDLQARLLIDSSRKSSNIAPILVRKKKKMKKTRER